MTKKSFTDCCFYSNKWSQHFFWWLRVQNTQTLTHTRQTLLQRHAHCSQSETVQQKWFRLQDAAAHLAFRLSLMMKLRDRAASFQSLLIITGVRAHCRVGLRSHHYLAGLNEGFSTFGPEGDSSVINWSRAVIKLPGQQRGAPEEERSSAHF